MTKLHKSWLKYLQNELSSPYMAELKQFLKSQKENGKTIYPKEAEWFIALNATPLDKVRVVILGQDPYHAPKQAHGLCFSVKHGTRIPPSLVNIYKELQSDLGITPPNHGNLQAWASQGVLLLNSVLTVEASLAASHKKRGWEKFTDAVIKLVNEQNKPIVFILWGAYAQKKASFVNANKHLVLKSVHPSPLSAHNGFFNTKPFSKTNHFLEQQGDTPINWQLENYKKDE